MCEETVMECYQQARVNPITKSMLAVGMSISKTRSNQAFIWVR